MRELDRRQFLKIAGLAAVGTFLGIKEAGCSQDTQISNPVITPEAFSNRAWEIRRKIADFEASHANEVTEVNLQHLFEMIKELYLISLSRREAQPTSLEIVSNERFQEVGGQSFEDPWGHAGVIEFSVPLNGKDEVLISQIPLFLFLGRPDNFDPSLNKLSVLRSVMQHEFTHVQTKPSFKSKDGKIQPQEIIIGNKSFRFVYTRGLKWIQQENDQGVQNDIAHFFDEANTQLITEYVNDPAGNDFIFQQVANSPVFDESLAPNYLVGADLLRKIYQGLGISIEEVAKYHLDADPAGLLKKIDNEYSKRDIKLDALPSTILIELNPQDPHSEAGLEGLKELAHTLG